MCFLKTIFKSRRKFQSFRSVRNVKMLDEKEHFMNGKEELKNKNLKPKRFRETTKFKKFQKIMVF